MIGYRCLPTNINEHKKNKSSVMNDISAYTLSIIFSPTYVKKKKKTTLKKQYYPLILKPILTAPANTLSARTLTARKITQHRNNTNPSHQQKSTSS